MAVENASAALDIRSIGMLSSSNRAESPQRRGSLWLQLGGCAAVGLLLACACGLLMYDRHYVEGSYAIFACIPCVWLAWDAHVSIERIDKQGFLPVRLITNRF